MNARGTTHEARILVMAMVAASAAVVLAMPTQQELKNAQPLVAELMAPTMDDFKAKKAPRLFELYLQAKAQSVAEKDIAAFRAKLRKSPGSLPTIRNLAEALATSGDWDAALKEFAKLKDGAAQIAKKELDGSAKSTELGEFWWSYKPTYENADDTFEMHAAVHYRKALAAGEISGLKKNIVEQRIAKYAAPEALAGGAVVQPPAATTQSTGSIELKTGGASPFTVKGNEVTLELKNGAKLEFVKCPSGWVKVVDDYENKTVRKVEITRPFWIMKQGLRNDDVLGRTLEKYGTGHGFIEPNQEDRDMFCSDLTDELRGVLPKGYVVRPPSLVEWEYAYHAGDEDPGSEPFGSLLKFHDYNTFDTHKGTSPVVRQASLAELVN